MTDQVPLKVVAVAGPEEARLLLISRLKDLPGFVWVPTLTTRKVGKAETKRFKCVARGHLETLLTRGRLLCQMTKDGELYGIHAGDVETVISQGQVAIVEAECVYFQSLSFASRTLGLPIESVEFVYTVVCVENVLRMNDRALKRYEVPIRLVKSEGSFNIFLNEMDLSIHTT